MFEDRIYNLRKISCNNDKSRACILNNLLQSRDLYNVQTVDYDLTPVRSIDLDPTGGFLLVGLANGAVELQGVHDYHFGNICQIYRYNLSQFNIHRVQWSPGDDQFFSMLDSHSLHLVDPEEARAIEKFNFNLKAYWSEWNPNDEKMIAICGTQSQVRLIDIRSGSSVQTITLSAKSGLASHRATRCLWSKSDLCCLIVGDNEGYIHIYDTRQSSKPFITAGEERGQISGMSFTDNNCSIITSQGTDNRLVQWSFDKCQLVPNSSKFKKRHKVRDENKLVTNLDPKQKQSQPGSSRKVSKKQQVATKKQDRRVVSLPVDAYLKCQFYVTDSHLFCPCPMGSKKAKEFYIYNIETGTRIKTIKSDEILCSGSISAITGLLPESAVLYVGGKGRLRVWTFDEDHHRKLEEKKKQYHQTNWDSDEDL